VFGGGGGHRGKGGKRKKVPFSANERKKGTTACLFQGKNRVSCKLLASEGKNDPCLLNGKGGMGPSTP